MNGGYFDLDLRLLKSLDEHRSKYFHINLICMYVKNHQNISENLVEKHLLLTFFKSLYFLKLCLKFDRGSSSLCSSLRGLNITIQLRIILLPLPNHAPLNPSMLFMLLGIAYIFLRKKAKLFYSLVTLTLNGLWWLAYSSPHTVCG